MKLFKFFKATQWLAIGTLGLLAVPAFAHVSLVDKAAPAGSVYTAVFRVGHACKDAKFTTGVSVQLPSGFKFEAADPRAGWAQATQTATGKNGQPGLMQVSWTASTPAAALSGHEAGDFVLSGSLPGKTGPLWFKVLQTCDVGSVDWAQVPTNGVSTVGMDNPAARLDVMPANYAMVDVQGAWVRSTVPGQPGTGAFMSLTAKAATRLVSISSPVAGLVEVHEMKMDGDVMKMRAVTGLDLPAGQLVDLKSGGYHVMLMDLKRPVAPGSVVPMTLTFKDGKGVETKLDLSLPVAVSSPVGKEGEGHGMHQH